MGGLVGGLVGNDYFKLGTISVSDDCYFEGRIGRKKTYVVTPIVMPILLSLLSPISAIRRMECSLNRSGATPSAHGFHYES